jgi:hypothetical protein
MNYDYIFDLISRNMFKKKFEDFLRASNEISACPTTLLELAEEAGIDFKVSPGDNSKGGIFVPWRVGAYVAARDVDGVKNTLLLLDSFFQKEIKSTTGEPVYVSIYSHKGIEIADVEKELDYKYYKFHEPAMTLPLKIFDCAPIKGSVITLNIQVQSETEMSIVISGNTWAYKHQFTQVGIGGGWANPDAEDKGPYLRTLKDLDMTKQEDKETLFKVLGEGVLNDLALRVQVEGDIEDDSAVAEFIDQLKCLPNLHFQ